MNREANAVSHQNIQKKPHKKVFGSVTMRLLINEKGDVEAVDVLDSYPQRFV